MNSNVTHVLKISLHPGEFRSRLLRALESRGGPYGILRDPSASSRDRDSMVEWISYGAPDAYFGPKVTEWMINSKTHSLDAVPAKKKEARLEAVGLRASLSARNGLDGRQFQRRYAVCIFHLQALAAIPIQTGGAALPIPGGKGEPERDSILWKRLAKTAVKALYAFGLDLGEVIVRAGEEGRFTVEGIHPEPKYGGAAIASEIANAMAQWLTELEDPGDPSRQVMLGMDPEFLLFNSNTGKVVPASRYLEHFGVAGCDVLRYRGRRLFPLGELRPEPGSEPRDVVRHLLRAFQVAQQAISDDGLLWQAGSMPQRGFPLGGHLHFSGVPLTAELLRTLDNYLALPVALLEDVRMPRRRPRYGFLGDFRLQSHGGFEYRTLPSFLISPLVTKGVVALARLIIEDYPSLRRRPLQKDDLFHAFYSGHQKPLRRVWPQLAEDIISAASYPRYKSYIAPMMELVQSGHTWDESKDIRLLWKEQIRS